MKKTFEIEFDETVMPSLDDKTIYTAMMSTYDAKYLHGFNVKEVKKGQNNGRNNSNMPKVRRRI